MVEFPLSEVRLERVSGYFVFHLLELDLVNPLRKGLAGLPYLPATSFLVPVTAVLGPHLSRPDTGPRPSEEA